MNIQKEILLICSLLLLPYTLLIAQIKPAAEVDVVEMPVYEEENGVDVVYLEFEYAKGFLKNPDDYALVKPDEVLAIDLVFTKYPVEIRDWANDYDALMEKRLYALKEISPELFDNKEILWRYVLQTDCQTREEAENMFHGYAIWMIGDGSEPIAQTSNHSRPSPNRSRKSKKVRREEEEIEYEGIWRSDKMRTVRSIISQEEILQDSIAFKTLERHSGKWKNMLVVMDWTGSMYKYGASVMLWHQLNIQKRAIKHFVFFNDGDGIDDKQKRIGRTGGIYHCGPNSLDEVFMTMYRVMRKGKGGTREENDMEAVVKAMRKFEGDFDEIILIADNTSPVRDMALLKYVDKPIHVILCGIDDIYDSTHFRPHPHYIKTALETGGSLHTITDDIENLSDKFDGNFLQIGRHSWKLVKGQFRPWYTKYDE